MSNDDHDITSYPQATKENRALVAGLEVRPRRRRSPSFSRVPMPTRLLLGC